MAKILVVEDDEPLRLALSKLLQSQQHSVDTAPTGTKGLDYLAAFEYELLILDWDLPELSGIEVCRQYRLRQGTSPVLILTGKSSLDDKETGLDSGADDYLTKPFADRELLARVRSLLRRPKTLAGELLQCRHVSLDTRSKTCTVNGEPVYLQPNELALFEFLMRHRDHAYSVEQLIRSCWPSDADISSESVYSCIRRIRRKLDIKDQPTIIETVSGYGYKLNSNA